MRIKQSSDNSLTSAIFINNSEEFKNDIDIVTLNSFTDPRWNPTEWDQLLINSHTNTVFLTSAWLQAWSETIGAKTKIVIVLVKYHTHLFAAAAFQIKDGIVEFCGKGASDYNDFIIATSLEKNKVSQVIGLILKTVKEQTDSFNYFFLNRIPSESPSIFYSNNLDHFYSNQTVEVDAPVMEMSHAAEKLNKKRLNRQERLLKQLGSVSCNTYRRASDILPLLTELFEQHIKRCSKTSYTSLFLDTEYREFYTRLTELLDQSGWLRFTGLKLNDQIVAIHFGFFYNNSYIYYKPTFDIQFEKLSPGIVMIKNLIKQAQVDNAVELDFTIGSEAFKHRFATKIRHVIVLHITDSLFTSIKRRIQVFIDKMKMSLRRLYNCPFI